MKLFNLLRYFLFVMGSSWLALSSVSAQSTLTWDISGAGVVGGSGTWSTSNANWTTNGGSTNISWANVAGTPKNDAVIGGTAGTITLSEAISLRNLTINTTGYVITGQSLNFTNGTITVPDPGAPNTGGARIESNITGAPTIEANNLRTNEGFTLRAAAGGSMDIGAITGPAGNSAGIIYFEGGAGHTSTVASSTGPQAIFNSSGTWTVTGTMESRSIEVRSGAVVVSTGTLSNRTNQSLDILLSGGTLHYNNAAAIRDKDTSFNTGSSDFRITGGSIDQTSGMAITTSTFNPDMNWYGNWAFIGSNGANSNLFLGNGRISLSNATSGTGTRQVTVSNAATTLSVGGVIQHTAGGTYGLTKAGAGTLELRGANTYIGGTAINAGTLHIASTGSTHASSAVVVSNSGSTLVVNGTVSGTLVANASTTVSGYGTVVGAATVSGNLNLGSSPGELNFTNSLTLANTSATTMKINGASLGLNHDNIDVGTDLAYDGALTLAIGAVFGTSAVFDLFEFGSQSGSFDSVALTGSYGNVSLTNNSGIWSATTNSGNQIWSFSQATGDLTLTVVPEPSSVLLLLSSALLLRRCRR